MKLKLKPTILTVLAVFAFGTVAASYFRSVFIDEIGEPNSNYVRSVLQDKDGYIWFGSINGLCRYDGYNMMMVTPSEAPNRKLMLDSRIQAMREWKERYLFIRLRGRLYSCYDIQQDAFVDYTGNGSYKDPYRNYYITQDSCLWLFGNEDGCKRMVEKDGTFTSFKYTAENHQLPSNNVEFIEDGTNGNIWIGTGSGMVLVKNGQLRTVRNSGHFITMVTAGEKEYFMTREGEVWLAQANGNLTLQTTPQQAGLAMPPVVASAATAGKIYITTTGETYEYDIAARKLSPSTTVHLTNGQLKTDNRGNRILYMPNGEMWYFGPQQPIHLQDVYSDMLYQLNSEPRFEIVTDSKGVIWVSTFGNGIYSYNPQTQMTHHVKSTLDSYSPLKTNYLVSLYEDKSGNIWACQEYMGVVCLSEEDDNVEYQNFGETDATDHSNIIRLMKRTGSDVIYIANMYNGLKRTDGNLGNPQYINTINDDVVALTTDKDQHLWIGTRKSGVYVDGKNFQHVKDDASSLDEGKISDIFCDSKGRVWISIFDKGIDYAEPDGNGGYRFRHLFAGKNQIEQPRSMLQDHAGYIWVASSGGVYYFHPDEILKDPSRFQRLATNVNHDDGVEVHCLYEDTNHQVWTGTIGFGVVTFDNSQAGKPVVKETMNVAKGLVNNNVQLIIGDQEGKVWMGTDNGLSMYNPKNQQLLSFFLSPHSMGNMFTENSVLTLNNQHIAFGTRHGVLIIDPANFKIHKDQFPLAITDIQINGVSYRDIGKESPIKGALTHTQEISLGHEQNSLTFYFSDFDYSAGKNTKYTYKLEGVDEEWSPLSNINFATYKNLSPGTYRLFVRSCNSNGIWNDKTVELEICIRSPWWATWWAYLIYLFFLAAIGFQAYHHFKRVYELNNKVKVEKQLTEYKLRFYTNISHEFRTPLTIIKGSMERLMSVGQLPGEMKQPLSSMRKGTDRMLRLINQLLEFRKMEQGKLQLGLEETNIVEFLQDIWLTFRETAENKRINYQFIPFAKEHHIFVDKSFLDKIMYNLLSNALKYTPSKHDVVLRVRHDNDQRRTLIIVEDTGIGIPKEKQEELFTRFNRSSFLKDSIGIGLHLTQELVRVHHGTIEYQEKEEGGSIFTVTLPDDKTVYQENDFLVADNAVLKEENDQQQQTLTSYKEQVSSPMNELTVLVVEDDTSIQEYLREELQHYFHVDCASNGAEALEMIKEKRPDLIISDVMMPTMTGFELTNKLRADKELADIPIILLTALTSEEKMVKGFDSGADAYIEKPFSPSVLIARCRQLLNQRNQLRTSYAKEVVGKVSAPEIIIEEQDRRFQELLDTWLSMHLTDSSLNIDSFAESMGYGRTTFFKKVKKITGQTPNDYIKTMRMNHAAELLKDDKLTISQVSYMVGIDDPYYFSKSFKAFFGVTPSNYRKGKTS